MINPYTHLHFNSCVYPNGIAIASLKNNMSLTLLLSTVKDFAKTFRVAGVTQGSVVLTALPSRDIDWVVTLALFHEAAITGATHSYQEPTNLHYDFFVSDHKIDGVPDSKMIVIDQQWIDSCRGTGAHILPVSYASMNSICRLILTSGTTGGSKVVPISYQQLEARCTESSLHWGKYSPTVSLMSLATTGGFEVAYFGLRSGTPLLHATSADDLPKLINAYKVSSIVGSPIQFSTLIETCQKNQETTPSLQMVRYAGGVASLALLKNIATLICPNIMCVYGATELSVSSTYLISFDEVNSYSAGFTLPNSEVQIVNAQDEVLATNEQGIVRIRTSGMSTEYYNDEANTLKFFRNGWFYPGDIGSLDGNNMLSLGGRSSELINIGGVKLDPNLLDQFILSQANIIDAATFSLRRPDQAEMIGLALVITEDFDVDKLLLSIRQVFGSALVPSTIFRMPKIPRNLMGKPLRIELSTQFSTH